MSLAAHTAGKLRVLYGNVRNQIKVEILTDSEPLLKSIASTERVENLNIVNVVELMKENLLAVSVSSYSYIETRDNIADLLTKYKAETQDFRDIFVNSKYNKDKKIIEVKVVKQEVGNEIRIFGKI